MNEPVSIFVSILEALISPKIAIKYLITIVVLLFFWDNLELFLIKKDLSENYITLVVLTISAIIGLFVGHVISWIYGFLLTKHKESKKKALALKMVEEKAAKEIERKERENTEILEKIKVSIDHLPAEQRETLWMLTTLNTTLNVTEENNAVLLDNKYIQKISLVGRNRYLVKLNPAISNFLEVTLSDYKKTKIEDFFNNEAYPDAKLSLLEITDDIEIPVAHEILRSIMDSYSCINCEQQEHGYYVWFDRFMLEAFQSQTGKSYQDEVYISDDMVY